MSKKWLQNSPKQAPCQEQQCRCRYPLRLPCISFLNMMSQYLLILLVQSTLNKSNLKGSGKRVPFNRSSIYGVNRVTAFKQRIHHIGAVDPFKQQFRIRDFLFTESPLYTAEKETPNTTPPRPRKNELAAYLRALLQKTSKDAGLLPEGAA